MFFGLIIIIIGVVLLLKNLNILTTTAWSIIYPAIVILIGGVIVFRKRGRKTDSFNIDE